MSESGRKAGVSLCESLEGKRHEIVLRAQQEATYTILENNQALSSTAVPFPGHEGHTLCCVVSSGLPLRPFS